MKAWVVSCQDGVSFSWNTGVYASRAAAEEALLDEGFTRQPAMYDDGEDWFRFDQDDLYGGEVCYAHIESWDVQ